MDLSLERATDQKGNIMAGTFTNLIYHLVFSTKNREPMIHETFEHRLYEFIGGIVKGKGGTLLAIGGRPDHLHFATKFKPVDSLSKLIGEIKGNSSKWLNEQDLLLGRFFCQ